MIERDFKNRVWHKCVRTIYFEYKNSKAPKIYYRLRIKN